ncbi:MAG TPA: hypothetical protein VGB63_00575 [Pedobacter sp.]|jgi:hypothetical protein
MSKDKGSKNHKKEAGTGAKKAPSDYQSEKIPYRKSIRHHRKRNSIYYLTEFGVKPL